MLARKPRTGPASTNKVSATDSLTSSTLLRCEKTTRSLEPVLPPAKVQSCHREMQWPAAFHRDSRQFPVLAPHAPHSGALAAHSSSSTHSSHLANRRWRASFPPEKSPMTPAQN